MSHKLVRLPKFESDVKSLEADYPRIHDAVDGVVSALRVNPYCRSMEYVDYGIYAMSLGSFPGVPAANIYYQVTLNEIRLMYIQLIQTDCVDDD